MLYSKDLDFYSRNYSSPDMLFKCFQVTFFLLLASPIPGFRHLGWNKLEVHLRAMKLQADWSQGYDGKIEPMSLPQDHSLLL